jgi:3-isopropylmalate/(R)-2-methylmalate dehydratase small subunit
LQQYGFRALIAPSYADIFFNNSFKNGLLPIVLPEGVVASLFAAVESTPGYELTVDLAQQRVTAPNGESWAFEVDGYRKESLLKGLDEIGQTLLRADQIRVFEADRLARHPWLVKTTPAAR